MAKEKILHILFPEKFFHRYIEFVNQNFDAKDHLFLYLKTKGNEPKSENVKVLRFYRWGILYYLEMFRYAQRADRIILHSLSKSKVLYFLFLFRRFAPKSYWYLWGGDLYYRIESYAKPIYNLFSKHLFKSVVGKLGGIVTHVKGDYELAKKEFGFQGRYFDCFLYPSNIFSPQESIPKTDLTKWILVGNSSHVSNNHIEVFEKLKYIKDSDVRIVCPLSYGDKKNSKRVIKHGREIFGDKFVALTKFMSLNEYNDLLGKIDVAIFNHWRQQAIGNIITLLGMGKTVYIRKEVTTWNMLESRGVKVLNFSDFKHLEEISSADKKANTINIESHFSASKLVLQLTEIFEPKEKTK